MADEFKPLDEGDVAHLVGTFLSLVRDCAQAQKYLALSMMVSDEEGGKVDELLRCCIAAFGGHGFIRSQ